MAREYINKPPIETTVLQEQGFMVNVWKEWVGNIERILGRSNNEQFDFTPTAVSLGGSGTLTGSCYRFNAMVFFEITISGTTDSTAGTTYISNLPFIASRNGNCVVNNATTNISIGTGLVEENNSSTTDDIVKCYLPTWGSTSDNFSISGNYRIKI